mgnify:CR=1 FL=1
MHVTIQNIKNHSGVIIYLRTVKIKRENGRFESKRWYARDASNSLAGKLRRNCGEVAGENFPVDADQSFWSALAHIMYSVSLTKIGECDKDSILCSFR